MHHFNIHTFLKEPCIESHTCDTLFPLVCDLQLVHHRSEDAAVGVRLRNAFLAEVLESRRDVLVDRRQQL